MPLIDWEAPDSINDAYARRDRLVAEIQQIDKQLGDRARRRRAYSINREHSEEWVRYLEWRNTALTAKFNREQDLRLTKRWIRKSMEEVVVALGTGVDVREGYG